MTSCLRGSRSTPSYARFLRRKIFFAQRVGWLLDEYERKQVLIMGSRLQARCIWGICCHLCSRNGCRKVRRRRIDPDTTRRNTGQAEPWHEPGRPPQGCGGNRAEHSSVLVLRRTRQGYSLILIMRRRSTNRQSTRAYNILDS